MDRTLAIPSFSSRSNFGEPDPLYRELRQVYLEHHEPINLASWNLTRVGLELPELPTTTPTPRTYDPDPRGLKSARQALALAYQERASVSSDDFILTASTSEAYAFVLATLCDPGDSVAVPEPSYPLFDQLARLSGVRLVRYPVAYDGAFHIDLSRLPSERDIQTERIKALFCVSPNNPTGNRVTDAEFERLAALSLPIIFDEVFLPYDEKGRGIDPLAQAHSLVLVLDGLSKRAAGPGMKLGWILAHGDQKRAFLARAEWVSDAFLSVGGIQHALPEILAGEANVQAVIKRRLSDSREVLKSSPLTNLGWTQLATDGGFSGLYRLPATRSEGDWWREFARAGVWIEPGDFYGLAQSPAFAISLLTPGAKLRAGIERLVRCSRGA